MEKREGIIEHNYNNDTLRPEIRKADSLLMKFAVMKCVNNSKYVSDTIIVPKLPVKAIAKRNHSERKDAFEFLRNKRFKFIIKLSNFNYTILTPNGKKINSLFFLSS